MAVASPRTFPNGRDRYLKNRKIRFSRRRQKIAPVFTFARINNTIFVRDPTFLRLHTNAEYVFMLRGFSLRRTTAIVAAQNASMSPRARIRRRARLSGLVGGLA